MGPSSGSPSGSASAAATPTAPSGGRRASSAGQDEQPPRRGLRQRADDGRQRRAVRRHHGAARQPARRARPGWRSAPCSAATGCIKGKHLDAWVEIRVANGSWRVLPTRAFMGRRPPRRDSAPLPEVRLPPEQRPPGPARSSRSPRSRTSRRRRTGRTRPPTSRCRAGRCCCWSRSPSGVVPAAQGAAPPAPARRHPASLAYLGGWDELRRHRPRPRRRRAPQHPARPGRCRSAYPRGLARDADVATFSPDEPDTAEEFWALVDEEPLRAQVLRPPRTPRARAARPALAAAPASLTRGISRTTPTASPAW